MAGGHLDVAASPETTTAATTAAPSASASGRDWWVACGMAVTAVSAAVASFSGLRGLAELAGWPQPLAALLPLTVDAHALMRPGCGWLGPRRARERAATPATT